MCHQFEQLLLSSFHVSLHLYTKTFEMTCPCSFVTHHVKVYYGLLKEPEIELPLDDEDEEAENEEGKPKKKKPKKDSMGSKSKKQDPNAPSQNR